ncbi:hypothetical protein KM043_015324 [Ampulex compressa]|nr:hypothetical protein KM043_015324 [Ampulex compressa]
MTIHPWPSPRTDRTPLDFTWAMRLLWGTGMPPLAANMGHVSARKIAGSLIGIVVGSNKYIIKRIREDEAPVVDHLVNANVLLFYAGLSARCYNVKSDFTRIKKDEVLLVHHNPRTNVAICCCGQ